MQHQQNRNDFADGQTGLRPARRGAVPDQIRFPLRQKRLAKIVHRTEGFHQPFQHFDPHVMVGSAHFLGSLIHNALMPPIPVIGVTYHPTTCGEHTLYMEPLDMPLSSSNTGQVKIPQKTVKHQPVDKLLDALMGMLCGAKTIAQSNVTVRVDLALQRAFGRKGCAEQSTIARTLHACTAQTVTQLEGLSWYYVKRYGQAPHHRFAQQRLWVDIDVTPLQIGAKAEGSERTWMGRCRSKTGRKVLRVTASDYREVLHETLLRGKASALPTLKTALRELEARLHWTRERRGADRAPPRWWLWHHCHP